MIAAQYEKTGNQLSANGWNGLVDATRRSMVGISDGMLMDQSPMGGTTMTAVRQMRPIRAKSESMFLPFALRAVNVGSVQHPDWKKIFYFPKYACDIIGGWAECDNEKFVGGQMWAKGGDWYYIADPTGNAGQAHIPAQETVETVYLHVLKAVDGNEEIRSAIVTNSQLIPEDFNGYETDCICIGKFDCPTPQQIGAGLGPRVLEQYVSGQVQVYGDIFPLKLTVVNIGTDAEPEWVKAFWFSEGSVLYDGDVFANCHNKPYPGYTMGGEGLYFVANPEGSNTQVPLQEDVAYAFLHVKYTGDSAEPCIAIVTNDDVTIPAEFEGEEDYCCCIGRFTCPSAAQIGTGIVPAVDQQFISSQIQVPVFSGDSDYPLKLKWINKGTEQSPNMVIGIYIPRGSVTLDTGIEGTLLGTAITGMTDWYEVVPSPGVSPDPIINYIVGKAVDKDDSEWDIRPWYFIYGTRPITSADADAAGMVYRSWGSIYIGENDHGSLVDFKSGHAWIHPPVISQGGGGGGDGDKVVISDQRWDKTKPGVATFDHEVTVDGQHSVYFSIFDTLGVDKVVFGTEEGQGLIDYLKGNLEVEGEEDSQTNVNTENFEDECLEESGHSRGEEMDLVGEGKRAARDDHKHTINEILGEDDEGNLVAFFSTVDNIKGMFEDVGLWGDLEEPLDPDNPDGTIIAASDVNFENTDIIKPFAKEADAGGGDEETGALLALADHVHPLPTDGTGATGIGTDDSDIDPFPSTDPMYGSEELRAADLERLEVFQQEWDRDSDEEGKGVKFTICVGYAKIRDLMYSVMREVEFDQYGLLRKVSKAKYAIYHPTMI